MSAAFINRVARVLVGTLGAQLITIGVTLLLVRLYSPAEMGAFSVWLSFATIFAVVVTGRYELAIFRLEKRANSGNRQADTSVDTIDFRCRGDCCCYR